MGSIARMENGNHHRDRKTINSEWGKILSLSRCFVEGGVVSQIGKGAYAIERGSLKDDKGLIRVCSSNDT